MELAVAVVTVLGIALGIYAKVYANRQAGKPEDHIEETDRAIHKDVVSGDRVAIGLRLKQLYDKARRSRGARGQ